MATHKTALSFPLNPAFISFRIRAAPTATVTPAALLISGGNGCSLQRKCEDTAQFNANTTLSSSPVDARIGGERQDLRFYLNYGILKKSRKTPSCYLSHQGYSQDHEGALAVIDLARLPARQVDPGGLLFARVV